MPAEIRPGISRVQVQNATAHCSNWWHLFVYFLDLPAKYYIMDQVRETRNAYGIPMEKSLGKRQVRRVGRSRRWKDNIKMEGGCDVMDDSSSASCPLAGFDVGCTESDGSAFIYFLYSPVLTAIYNCHGQNAAVQIK
jgi:hypothetical protein